MKNIVDKEWLLKNLQNPNLRIVDCRFSLAHPNKGLENYEAGHIPGAVYFDLEKDLSSPVREHGGRHPLPLVPEFVEKLELAGIGDDTIVVAYDFGEASFAARFWWLLQFIGHEKVYVLDEGFNGWANANYPITMEHPSFEKANIQININDQIIATTDEVREFVKSRPGNITLIDSRESKRYLGLEEPIDKKAGHIPGAINKPWMEGLSQGSYKATEEQKERFSELSYNEQIIVYCGSGVTACPNYLALRLAGYQNVKLYVGSFSDWISYNDHEID